MLKFVLRGAVAPPAGVPAVLILFLPVVFSGQEVVYDYKVVSSLSFAVRLGLPVFYCKLAGLKPF